MATTTSAAGGLTIPLEQIHVPDNVRALNADHVRGLAASIGLQGMLVPIVVCPAERDTAAAGFQYELAAGFHRVAAARELELAEVPAVVRDSAGEQADRPVENIARLALRPDEEAAAAKAISEISDIAGCADIGTNTSYGTRMRSRCHAKESRSS